MAEDLTLRVRVNDAQLKSLERQLGGLGSSAGKGLKRTAVAVGAIGVAATGVAVKAVKMNATFDQTLQQTVGLAGVAQKTVDKWGKQMLRLAPKVAKPPQELAEAMYFVASSGAPASKAMDILTKSARASAAGLGDTQVVADAVTSAMNAYGPANMTAAHATNALVATVREGKGEAADFATVIGSILPQAAGLGVSLDDVGAALAGMTRLGTPAEKAAVQLQYTFQNLLKVTPKAEAAFKKVGLSSDGLRATLKEKGLLAMLQELQDHFHGNQKAMVQAFPSVQALRGVLALTGKQAGSVAGIFKRMKDNTGDLDKAFDAASKGGMFKWKQLTSATQAFMISLGGLLAPLAQKLADFGIQGVGALQGVMDKLGSAKGGEAKLNVVLTSAQDAGKWMQEQFNKIDWDAIWAGAEGFGNGLQNAFEKINWNEVGKAIATGLATGIKEGAQLAKSLSDSIMESARTIKWDQLGKQIGPGLAAALVSAFVTLTDPMFWLKNWDLLLAVAIVAFPVGKLTSGIGKIVFAGFERLFPGVAGRIGKLIGSELGWKMAVALKYAWDLYLKAWQAGGRLVFAAVKGLFGRLAKIAVFALKVLGVSAAINQVVKFGKAVVDWGKRVVEWFTNLPGVVAGALGGVGSSMRGLVSGPLGAFRSAIGMLRTSMAYLSGLFDRIKGKLSDLLGPLKTAFGFVKGFAGKVVGGGDGLMGAVTNMKSGALPVGKTPAGLAAVMGGPLALGRQMGLVLSSGFRPGAITSTGNKSLHSTGHAIDMAGPPAAMAAYAQAMAGRPGVRELLYSPLGGWYPGQGWGPLSGTLKRDHYSHVHVGMGDGRVGVGDGVVHRLRLSGDGRIGDGKAGDDKKTASELKDAAKKLKEAAQAHKEAAQRLQAAPGVARAAVAPAKQAIKGLPKNLLAPVTDEFGNLTAMLSPKNLPGKLKQLQAALQSAFAKGKTQQVADLRSRISDLASSITTLRDSSAALKTARKDIDGLIAASKNLGNTPLELQNRWGQVVEKIDPKTAAKRLGELRKQLLKPMGPEALARVQAQIEKWTGILQTGFDKATQDAADAAAELQAKTDAGWEKMGQDFGPISDRLLRVFDTQTDKMLGAIDTTLTGQLDTIDKDMQTALDAVDKGLDDKLTSIDDTLAGQIAALDKNLQASNDAIDAWAKELTPAEAALESLRAAHDAAGREMERSDAVSIRNAAQARLELLKSRGASAKLVEEQAKVVADAEKGVAEQAYTDQTAALEAQGETERTLREQQAQEKKDQAQADYDLAVKTANDLATVARAAAQASHDDLVNNPDYGINAVFALKRKTAEDDAAAQKLELQSQRDEQRIHLEADMAAWVTHLSDKQTTAATAQASMIAMLGTYGIDYQNAGDGLGSSFGQALVDSFGTYWTELTDMIAALNAAQPKKPAKKKVKKAQHGGIFTRPTLALIGEAGPEAVIPLPKMRSLGAAGASSGGTVIVLNLSVEGAIGDPNEIGRKLAEPVRRELLRVGRRNVDLWR